jgi:hypothetical protein
MNAILIIQFIKEQRRHGMELVEPRSPPCGSGSVPSS